MSSHVFGPVPSRRLGRSLGVDLIPFKTCSFDCIYCQLGVTTCKTVERKEWVPIEPVLAELREKLSSNPDYITVSGSGEPTLHCRIGELIERIKTLTDVPVAVLTNGSMFWDETVRRQLLRADLVVPSLDAGDEETFRRVNRPHEDVSFEQLMAGLIAFRGEFGGRYWLEVFLLSGINADDEHVERLIAQVDRIRPDRIQLNTVARPTAESSAIAVPEARMHELAARFHPPAEVIGKFHPTHEQPQTAANRDHILELLRRRPCTLHDIANGLELHENEVVKYLADLRAEGTIAETRVAGRLHYRAGR
jgi:wyosine [tRNA(Phe)-imidazoG37] synthetase (radical SAM superfamily)